MGTSMKSMTVGASLLDAAASVGGGGGLLGVLVERGDGGAGDDGSCVTSRGTAPAASSAKRVSG